MLNNSKIEQYKAIVTKADQ